MKRWLVVCSLSASLFSGCHISSRTSMYGAGGRQSYNIAAQNTTNEELLLNLVRLRYSDTPYFLELNNITTQYSFSGKLSGGGKIPGFDSKNPAVIGAEMGWQTQPTIQYSPLEGKDFAIQLMHPLGVRVLQGLLLTGWSIDRVFNLLVQNLADIQNVCSGSGPIPRKAPCYADFKKVIGLLHYFQNEGKLQIGVGYTNTGSKIEDKPIPNTLQLSFPKNDPKSKELADLLHVKIETKGGDYIVHVVQGYDDKADVGIITRSLLGCMYYLSLGVEVPQSDLASGVVGKTKTSTGEYFDWATILHDVMTIQSAPYYPEYAYLAIRYRNRWFYIDDRDLASKNTFVLLQQIYNLQARQVEKEPPILTLPIGGRI